MIEEYRRLLYRLQVATMLGNRAAIRAANEAILSFLKHVGL